MNDFMQTKVKTGAIFIQIKFTVYCRNLLVRRAKINLYK